MKKSKVREARIWVEYKDLSKRGRLSSYDWFVVEVMANIGGKTVAIRTDEFEDRAKAWALFCHMRDALSPEPKMVGVKI